MHGTETVAYACSAFLTYGLNGLTGLSSYCLLFTSGRDSHNIYRYKHTITLNINKYRKGEERAKALRRHIPWPWGCVNCLGEASVCPEQREMEKIKNRGRRNCRCASTILLAHLALPKSSALAAYIIRRKNKKNK